MSVGLFSRPDDNILTGSTPSGTTPSTTYSLATVLDNVPLERVLFPTGTATITFTLGSSKRGDLLFIPVHNLDAGATVLTLTNGNGFSAAITVPAMPPHRIPAGIVADLRGLASASTRTDTVWHVVVTSNSVPVLFGGCIWIGQIRTFDRNFRWGARNDVGFNQNITKNEYGTEYVVDYETINDGYTCSFADASDSDGATLLAWTQATHGGVLASVFWPDTAGEAFLGRTPAKFAQTYQYTNWREVPWVFPAITKGKPV